jgi:hypothetical protein
MGTRRRSVRSASPWLRSVPDRSLLFLFKSTFGTLGIRDGQYEAHRRERTSRPSCALAALPSDFFALKSAASARDWCNLPRYRSGCVGADVRGRIISQKSNRTGQYLFLVEVTNTIAGRAASRVLAMPGRRVGHDEE